MWCLEFGIWQRLKELPHSYSPALCVSGQIGNHVAIIVTCLLFLNLCILHWMDVISVTHSLILTNTSYILEHRKMRRQHFVPTNSSRVPTASIYEAAKLPGKINEFLSKSAKHVDNSPILLQSKFGKRRTIWKLVRSCQPDAFGISDGEGGRRGWKMPPNKKAMVSNAFLRLVAVNLNLPWPFVWPEWAIREEFRQGVCADGTEFRYILCKNVFRGQVRAVYLHSQMDNGPVIHSNWNQNPVILTLVTEVTLRISF